MVKIGTNVEKSFYQSHSLTFLPTEVFQKYQNQGALFLPLRCSSEIFLKVSVYALCVYTLLLSILINSCLIIPCHAIDCYILHAFSMQCRSIMQVYLYFFPSTVVLIQGKFCPPGDIWQCLGIFLLSQCRKEAYDCHLIGRIKGCCFAQDSPYHRQRMVPCPKCQ